MLYFGHLDSSDYIRTSVPAICYTPNIGNPYSCEKVKWIDKRFMNMCAILFQTESWTLWVQVGHLGSFSQKALLYCVIMNNVNMFECILQYLDFRPSVQHLLIPTIMCTCGYWCHIHVCHIMVKFVSMNLQFSVIYERLFNFAWSITDIQLFNKY